MLKGCEMNMLLRQERKNIRENAEGEIVSEFALNRPSCAQIAL